MIESYSFGKMRIQGKDYTQDLKIIKGEVSPQWWRKTGHKVDTQDVQDILEAKPSVLVLGKGRPGQMQAKPELRELLAQNDIQLVELPTEQAVQEFNRMWSQGENVAAGFHLTC